MASIWTKDLIPPQFRWHAQVAWKIISIVVFICGAYLELSTPVDRAEFTSWIMATMFICVAAFGLVMVVRDIVRYRYLSERYKRVAENRCLNCGYPLKGLPNNRCPECGTSFLVQRSPHN